MKAIAFLLTHGERFNEPLIDSQLRPLSERWFSGGERWFSGGERWFSGGERWSERKSNCCVVDIRHNVNATKALTTCSLSDTSQSEANFTVGNRSMMKGASVSGSKYSRLASVIAAEPANMITRKSPRRIPAKKRIERIERWTLRSPQNLLP